MLLRVDTTELSVCRLDAGAGLPTWACDAVPLHFSRRAEETSIVCPSSCVPVDHDAAVVRVEGGWVSFTVDGTLDFALTGILASLAAPLAQAGVSIFAISTYDTDILLVRSADFQTACATLRAAGNELVGDF